MIVEFLSEAKSELFDSVAYYEGEQSGLGQRLWDEVDQHITWIAENYEVPRLRPGGYRRVNLKIFLYYISYVVRDSVINRFDCGHEILQHPGGNFRHQAAVGIATSTSRTWLPCNVCPNVAPQPPQEYLLMHATRS